MDNERVIVVPAVKVWNEVVETVVADWIYLEQKDEAAEVTAGILMSFNISSTAHTFRSSRCAGAATAKAARHSRDPKE